MYTVYIINIKEALNKLFSASPCIVCMYLVFFAHDLYSANKLILKKKKNSLGRRN